MRLLMLDLNWRLFHQKPQRGGRMRSASLGLIISLLIITLLAWFSVPSGTATSPPIIMATDKTHYARGETVTLKATNNLDIPIWYIDYPQRDLVFWTIERAKDNGWHSLDFRLPLIEGGREVCRIVMYERPIGVIMDLKPHSDLLYEWNQRICLIKILKESTEPEMFESGRYRFLLRYSLDTVKLENAETQPWKRPIDLGEIEVVYSNEFVLE